MAGMPGPPPAPQALPDSQALACFGTTEPVAAPLVLQAGPLRCLFDAGAVRSIRWHGVEVVRAIGYLLRDADWGTVPAVLQGLQVDQQPDHFDLRFGLCMHTPQGTLLAAASLQGHADGRLHFDVLATPDADLRTNRCGFVVLHPAACAGRSLQVEHTDGRIEDSCFPALISPGQPALDIRGLQHDLDGGVQVQLRLQAQLPGDPAGKFEMEDQRNWSDASFKTYVASLLDPWPYTLPKGQALRQSVALRLRGPGTGVAAPATVSASASAPGQPLAPAGSPLPQLQLGTPGGLRLSALGVGVPPGVNRASPAERQAWLDLGAQWWQVEAALDDPQLPADLAVVAAQHRRSPGTSVQLDMVVPDSLPPAAAARAAAHAAALASLAVHAVRLLPAALLKSHQPAGPWPVLPPPQAYADAARACFPAAVVGGGMFTGFTEVNRHRACGDGADFVGHLTWPTVHDAADEAVMQTLEALPHIGRSLQALFPGRPCRLGPSTLAMRRNPYGDQPADNPQRVRMALARQDPRHAARFGAAWTLGYAAAVAPLGLQVLALHEVHGPSGPIHPGHRAGGSCGSARRPEADSAVPVPVPAWAVLQTLAHAAGALWVPVASLPSGLAALVWQHPGQAPQGLVANLTPQPQWLRLPQAFAGRTLALGAYQVLPLDAPLRC